LLIQNKGGASDFPSALNTGHKNVTDSPFAIPKDFVNYNFTTLILPACQPDISCKVRVTDSGVADDSSLLRYYSIQLKLKY